MAQLKPTQKSLRTFALVMINIIAIDNLRTLPFGAEFGPSLIGYYLLALLIFFLPIALVSTELATAWPNRGGIYVWVREAFGERWGFFVIWLQWVYNVAWYPTILAFIVGTFSATFSPHLLQHKLSMTGTIIALFWAATLINCRGMKLSSIVSSVGALAGTLLPMSIIIILGMVWWTHGNPSQLNWQQHNWIPDFSQHNLAFFVAVIFGLVGIEMSAVHADEVVDPETAYPRAMWISTLIIFSSLILSSLAIAMVVPHDKLNVITGITQALNAFLMHYDLQLFTPMMSALIIIGGLGSVATWIIGPTKGLLIAAQDGNIPACFAKVNRHGAPVPLLLLQAGLFTLISSLYLLMPSVESAYFLLTVMIAQLALIVYIVLFAAALKLRQRRPHRKRCFMVPGGKLGLWALATLGTLTCLGVIGIGFLPPKNFAGQCPGQYIAILLIGMIVLGAPPWLIRGRRK